MNNTTSQNTQAVAVSVDIDIDTIKEQFATHLLTTLCAAERLTAGGASPSPEALLEAAAGIRAGVAAMREAFDRMAALAAAKPRQVIGVPARKLRDWKILSRANSMICDNLEDTCVIVASYLEALAGTADAMGSGNLSHRFGEGLCQAIWLAVGALRVHVEPEEDGEAN